MYFAAIISIWIMSIAGIASANPVVTKTLNTNLLKARSPLSNAAFSDEWPTDVVFAGGSQIYGMNVPKDGSWYDLGTIQCLGLPAYAIGDCNDMTVDNIGVVAGDGPCSFIGAAGFTITIQGAAGDGYYTVGPPQNILWAKCG